MHFKRHQYAAAFAHVAYQETGEGPLLCPVNEISYVAWEGGSLGRINPFARGRGDELKRQLVRAALAGFAVVTAKPIAAAGRGRVGNIEIVPGQMAQLVWMNLEIEARNPPCLLLQK